MFLSAILSAAIAAEDTERAVRTFLASRLEVGTLNYVTQSGQLAGTTWVVAQGSGTVLTPTKFASIVKDEAKAAELKQRALVSGLAGGGLLAVGAGAVVAGGLMMNEPPARRGAAPYVLGGLGVASITGGAFVVLFSGLNRSSFPKFYSQAEAMERVDAYNDAKLQELGITRDDVSSYLKERSVVEPTVSPWIAANGLGISGTF